MLDDLEFTTPLAPNGLETTNRLANRQTSFWLYLALGPAAYLRDGLVDVVHRAVLEGAVVAVDAPDQLVNLGPQIAVLGHLRSRRHAHLWPDVSKRVS